jgi:hypothetical protein
MLQGEQWYESDSALLAMRYVNPDLTETLVSLGPAGGDFVPYGEKAAALGVATLDAGAQVPLSQLGNVPALPPVPTRVVLTTGTGTYTPPAGCRYIDVQIIGAGGSGGGGGGTIGNAAVSTGTTFGALSGGPGGPGSANDSVPTVGGAATGGDINIQGAPGQGANGNTLIYGGRGGSSFFGSGGIQNSNTPAYGAGGDGGVATVSNTGGGGAAGGYVRKLITSLAANYAYFVGAPGAAGTGTETLGTQAGSGIIIIDEFY